MWERRLALLAAAWCSWLAVASCGSGDGADLPAGAGGGGVRAGRAGEGAEGGLAGASNGGDGGDGEVAGAAGDGPSGPPLPPELTFTRERAIGNVVLEGVWGSGSNEVFAVGELGRLFHFYEGSWRLESGGTERTLTGIWGASANEVYVSVDSNLVLRAAARGSWGRESFPAGYATIDVWGSGPDDVYVLAGNGAFHRDGEGNWLAETIAPERPPVTAIWGSSAHDVYVVSTYASSPTVYHSTGDGSWEALPDSPQVTLADISGFSPEHIFVAGGDSVYFSAGDGTWTKELTLERDSVNAVFALGPGAVYACTENGRLFRSNGAGAWSEGQLVNPVGNSPACTAVWGSGPDDLYVGTDDGLFRGVISD